MADEDIYGSKRRYERFLGQLREMVNPPQAGGRRGRRRYHCRNPANLAHFRTLARHFETRDTSFVRRLRVLQDLLFITSGTAKDLGECERADIDEIVARSHEVNLTVSSKVSFLKNLKCVWRILFPERDERGRADETLTPYVVRHVSCRIDKSRQRRRPDRLTPIEFGRIVRFFSKDAKMQAFVTLALESLARPQELCYVKIGDVETKENYARIWVSSHGKEGVKFLSCIESHPYVMRWLAEHPFAGDPEAFLFFGNGRADRPLRPENVIKKLRNACRSLAIEKRITGYSLKRNGVTFRRLRGDPDVVIQHVANWTSLRQLSTYDLSGPEDTFKQELARHGLVEGGGQAEVELETRPCVCGARLGFADKVCRRCKRGVGGEGGIGDSRAENEIREVLGFAVKHPDRSLSEVMEMWRQAKLASSAGAKAQRKSGDGAAPRTADCLLPHPDG